MQSVIFLAFQHDCSRMEKSASRCQSKEEKKGKMKKTILKDWKARLNYFLQNSSNSTSAKANKKGQQKTCFRPSPEEAQLWSETFDELLVNKYGLAAFRAFLKSEFCEENIDFWLACEDYKKIKSPQKLTAKAKKIYSDFIEKEAPKEATQPFLKSILSVQQYPYKFLLVLQINIDFQTKNSIAQSIEEATYTCFSAAQKRVYSLMENNSYPRFLESEFYQELCRKSPISRDSQET
ncbi:hypothetical protein E2320_010604 [Naja naja]|nr:hypothetical protein E2320_010604 [Naja naja]